MPGVGNVVSGFLSNNASSPDAKTDSFVKAASCQSIPIFPKRLTSVWLERAQGCLMTSTNDSILPVVVVLIAFWTMLPCDKNSALNVKSPGPFFLTYTPKSTRTNRGMPSLQRPFTSRCSQTSRGVLIKTSEKSSPCATNSTNSVSTFLPPSKAPKAIPVAPQSLKILSSSSIMCFSNLL